MALLRVDQTPQGSEQDYSIGFKLWHGSGDSQLIGHTGSVAGYMAFLAFDPESGIGVILLTNYHPRTNVLTEPGLGLLRELAATTPH